MTGTYSIGFLPHVISAVHVDYGFPVLAPDVVILRLLKASFNLQFLNGTEVPEFVFSR